MSESEKTFNIIQIDSENNPKSYNSILEKSIQNIEDDRKVATKLLHDLVGHIDQSQNKATHREVGEIASKYLETLQRSNEQLVKLVGLMKKTAPSETPSLSKKEKLELLDELKTNKGD